MKFDLTVSKILEATDKKLYRVTHQAHSIDEYTHAKDKNEAIKNIAIKNKKSVKQWQGRDGAIAKEVKDKPTA
jgi:hypothetical protein